MYHPTTIVVTEKKEKCNYMYHLTTIVVREGKGEHVIMLQQFYEFNWTCG